MGKGQKSSLYGGSLLGSAVPKPYVEALRSQGFVKIPRGYKPKMTKTEVVAYLKKYAPEYPLKTIIRSKGSYWKETAFMIERGRTGELIVIGRKSEIEAGKLFGTVAERSAQKPFYTKVSNEEFFKSLERINRFGKTEFVSRVEAFKLKDILAPSSLKLKLMQRFAPAKDDFLLHWQGRSVGSFAPTRRIGRIVPIERYKAIPETQLEREQHFSSIEALKRTIRGSAEFKQVSAEAIEEQLLTKNIKQVIETDILSSKYRLPKSSLTYAEEYASMISFPKRSYASPSASYSRSYSSLKSAISSLLSSDMSRVSSFSSADLSFSSSLGSSARSFDYWSGSSFSTSSKPYKPYYPKIKLPHYDLLKEKIRKRREVTPEIMGLFPDFTARAIGLSPKELSLKDALKEIAKVQTGFEIRTGARIKGISPIDEKSLLKGVMA